MSEIGLRPDDVAAAARRLQDTGRAMPDPGWGPRCDAGADQVDELLAAVTAAVRDLLLGGAGECVRLGHLASAAAQAFQAADARAAAPR